MYPKLSVLKDQFAKDTILLTSCAGDFCSFTNCHNFCHHQLKTSAVAYDVTNVVRQTFSGCYGKDISLVIFFLFLFFLINHKNALITVLCRVTLGFYVVS